MRHSSRYDPPSQAATNYAGPDPYEDFRKRYTAEGGIAFTFKDHDKRWRWTVLKIVTWSLAMIATAIFARAAMLDPGAVIAVLTMSVIYALLLHGPIEIFRELEIRADCMIIESDEVFLASHMELGYPRFRQNAEGHYVLCGTYGTRTVEFLTTIRSDDLDRSPEVFASHLAEAMHQLWQPLR